MAFVGGLFGGSGGFSGLLQPIGANGPSRPTVQIFEVSANTLQAAFQAQATARAAAAFGPQLSGVSTRDRDAEQFPRRLENENTLSLEARIRAVRAQSQFIDTAGGDAERFEGDTNRQTAFVLFQALEDLRTLAEFSAERSTPDASREQLNQQFQNGLAEVRDFIANNDATLLEFFEGSSRTRADTLTALGRRNNTFEGQTIATDSDTDLITGLTGTESFDISITDNLLTTGGITNETNAKTTIVTIDLSLMTEPLTVENLASFINDQIAAIPLLDEEGNPVLDDDGEVVPDLNTRFRAAVDSSGNQSLTVESILTERVSLGAVGEEALFVASAVSQVDTLEFPITSRLTTFTGLSGALTEDGIASFAGIDIEGTEFRDAVNGFTGNLDVDDGGREVSPEVRARSEELRRQARIDVLGEDVVEQQEADDAQAEEDAFPSVTDITDGRLVTSDTEASKLVTASDGSIFVVGNSAGSFGRQLNGAETQDVFLTKFDSQGNEVFSRLLGSTSSASAYDVTLDSNGNVIVTGSSADEVAGEDKVFRSADAFIAKFTAFGNEVFRTQIDSFGMTEGLAVTTRSTGGPEDEIIIGGVASGAVGAGTAFGGQRDGLLLRLDGSTGAVTERALIGGTGREEINDIAIASDGNLLLALEEDTSAVLRKIDIDDFANEIFSVNLGSIGAGGSIGGLAVNGNEIAVAGTAASQAPDAGGSAAVVGSPSGLRDGFVTQLTDSGGAASADVTTIIGTDGVDRITDVAFANGSLFVTGTTTGTLAGEKKTGSTDSFVARIDAATNTVADAQQFGESGGASQKASSLAVGQTNTVLDTLGLASGVLNPTEDRTVITQTSVKPGDSFSIEIEDQRRPIRITIEEGDTFDSVARRINIAGFRSLSVRVSTSGDGDQLRITPLEDGPALTFVAGPDGRDALAGLGIDPGQVLPSSRAFNLSNDEDEDDSRGRRRNSEPAEPDLGGTFALRLAGRLDIESRNSARFVQSQLDDAIVNVQRAYRSLSPSILDLLGNQTPLAQPTGRQAARIANFQTALNRLSQGPSASGINLLL